MALGIPQNAIRNQKQNYVYHAIYTNTYMKWFELKIGFIFFRAFTKLVYITSIHHLVLPNRWNA